MYQILVKKFTKILYNLSPKRFVYNNLIGAVAKEADADAYHLDVCRSMNDHIMHRFTISHSYLTIANYFNEGKRFDGFTGLHSNEIMIIACEWQIDYAMPVSAYFYSMSERERSNAVAIALYQQRRGAPLALRDVVQPDVNGICPKVSLQHALNLEIDNWKSLSDVYMTAKRHDDIVTMETLAENYFNRQANIIEAIDYLVSLYNNAYGIDADTITQLTNRILFTEFYNFHHPLLLTNFLNGNKSA